MAEVMGAVFERGAGGEEVTAGYLSVTADHSVESVRQSGALEEQQSVLLGRRR